MADIIKLAIDKLNNDNYQSWKYEAELVLRRESTWHTITDEVPSATDGKVYTMWKSADSKAIGTIGLLVEKNQHVHIRKAKSAKEVWNNLKEQHEKSTLSSAVHMYRQLASMKLSEADNVENLIQAVQETADKLIAVEEPLTERFIMGMMLANLPNSYGTLITALECRAEADLNIGMVREKIIGEFRRRKESEKDCTVAVTSEAVLAIKTDKGTSVKNKTKAICHFCKKQGHFKSKCFKFKALQQEKLQAAKITTQTMSGGAKEVNSEAEHFCFKTETVEKNKWYIDSGATCHMTNSNEYFESLDTSVSEIVRVANGDTITSKGIGNLWLNCENNVGKMQMILLKNVRYVPELNGNLLSVRTLTKQGFDVHFNAEKCSIMKDDKTAAIAIPRNQLYELQCTQDALLTCFSNKEICLHNWHHRLGHRSPEAIKLLEQQSLANGIKISKCRNIMFCDTCAKGKLARLPFPKTSKTKTKSLLDLLHSDLCGPMQTQTPGGKRYILTLVDDYSRYCNIYLLARKSDVCEKIKEFVQFCCNNFGCKPKIIRSDRGGEYLNERLSTFFKSQGIQHQLTAPFSPQQNGVAERKNRSLTEMARCMLIDAVLPNQFWGEAVMTANYLQNRLPTKAIEGTPFEKWYGTKPDLKHIRIFGSKVYMHIPDEQRRKLDNKACELTFVGYAESSKAYRLLNMKTKRIFISRDVKFVETSHGGMSVKECKHEVINPEEDYVSNKECKQEVKNLEDDQCRGDRAGSKFQIDLEIDELTELPSEEMEETVRRSSRSSKGIPPQRLIQTCNLILDEPRSYKEAMAGPEMVQWKLAMEDELQSLSSNNVWKLCELPPGRQAISGKWVFKKKLDEHGNISRYKARYVAKGFSQKYGEDYDEVFAPVAKQTTFRTLLTVAGKFKMHVKHYDFKTAFLNGKIEEDLFLKQPEGFAESGNEHLVCKLQKSIYGLKQAARAWNKTLHEQLTNIGFSNSKADHCLYSKIEKGIWIYLIIYVDDIILASCSNHLIDFVTKGLGEIFELSSLGDLKFYLGINVERNSDETFSIHQGTYIDRIIENFGLKEAKPSKIPLDPGYEKRNEVHVQLKDNTQYRSAIGVLLYISNFTRPDIAVAISILSRKVSKPTEADWVEVKRVLRYLKGTRELKLKLGDPNDLVNQTRLIGYADANWATDAIDRKSNSGHIFKLFGASISWASRKQQCVSLSSTEAEYVSLSEACQEGIWISRLLKDFNLKMLDPFRMFEDNQSCLKLLDNNKISNRTKHIDTRFHFVKDLKENQQTEFVYCPTDEMVADILTKPLEAVKTRKFVSMLGLV